MEGKFVDVENHNFTIKCDNCLIYFPYERNNLYYPNAQQGISGICKKCYDDINLKLVLRVDISKLKIIKKKAEKLYLQRRNHIKCIS